MGLSLFGRSSSERTNDYARWSCVSEDAYKTPLRKILHPKDPKPDNFKIGRVLYYNKHLLAEIIYPNCTNFEGRKIILFRGVNELWLVSQRLIDPHFTDDNCIIARFRPDEKGWTLGKKCLKMAE